MINSQELEIIRSQIPSLVRNYRQMSPQSWRWSCDICGDSRKDMRKARFGVSVVKNELLCNCFNCGWSGTFYTYLGYQHPDLQKLVSRQKFEENKPNKNESYNDFIISKADSETLQEIYYINSEPNLKKWLSLLISKKIQIQNNQNQQKLVAIHKRLHDGTN